VKSLLLCIPPIASSCWSYLESFEMSRNRPTCLFIEFFRHWPFVWGFHSQRQGHFGRLIVLHWCNQRPRQQQGLRLIKMRDSALSLVRHRLVNQSNCWSLRLASLCFNCGRSLSVTSSRRDGVGCAHVFLADRLCYNVVSLCLSLCQY